MVNLSEVLTKSNVNNSRVKFNQHRLQLGHSLSYKYYAAEYANIKKGSRKRKDG